MTVTVSRPLERAFFPLSLALVAVLLAVVFRYAGNVTAIKGSYALIGLGLAAALYYGSVTRTRTAPDSSRSFRNLDVGVALVVAAAVAGGVLVDDRALVLLATLPVGYALLALQFRAGVPPGRLLWQVTALFLVGPVTQYLSTGFLFSHGDTFAHVRLVEALVATGFPHVLENYVHFPGLHAVTGGLTLLGGVAAYDAILVFGLVAFASLVPMTYLFARVVTGDSGVAVAVALALTLLEPLSFFATYFFPQALAVVLAYLLLFLAYRATGDDRVGRVRTTVLAVLLGLAIVLTHHLTLVFLVPIVLMLTVLPRFAPLFVRDPRRVLAPRGLVVGIAVAAAVVYWIGKNTFIALLIGELAVLFFSTRTFATDAAKPTDVFAYGLEIPAATSEMAFRSLASAEGVYYIVLIGVFCFGVAVALRGVDRYVRAFGVLATGVATAPLVFRTPIAIDGLTRVRFPMSLFFAFVLGVGLYALLRHARGSAGWTTAAVALVVVLGVTTPMVAGLDLYDVRDGPDLYEFTPVPETQVEFDHGEYRALEAAAAFVADGGGDVSTMSAERRTLERFGVDASSNLRLTERDIETPETAFLYRTRWADQGVLVGTGQYSTATVVVSEGWLRATVAGEQKVYDAGGVGLLWNEDGGPLGAAATGRPMGVA